MTKNLFCIVVSGLLFSSVYAQSVADARRMVDTLTSPVFWGRGYTNNGMANAADFLAKKFESLKLEKFSGKNYFQNFKYPVNTFPGEMKLIVNGKPLIPGVDFIVAPESAGIRASGKLEKADSITYIDREKRLIIETKLKLTWSVSQGRAGFTGIEILKSAIEGEPKSFEVKIDNEFQENFAASNVLGYVKGTSQPDSFIVITAHYDHLGGMGDKTFFPGANDNASGVAMLLALAEHYAKHPAKFSIAFIIFAGEEAGLLGSKHYTENPLFPLKNIAFLLNTDLAGTGDDGITVVNATEFPVAFNYLKEVNASQNLLKEIKPRGKAANSDHYFFSEKGVPAFFFYTLGGITAYHDVNDKAATLPLTEFEDLMKLVIGFNEKIMNRK